MKPALRCEQITPFIVMEILEKIQKMEARGIDVIHMEIGEPDFDVPECVNKVSMEAFCDKQTHYTHSLGLFELRDAICQYYLKTYGVSIDPDQVIVTSGSSPAIFLIFSALLEKNDQVIISDPHYACYPNFIKFVQGQPVTIPVYEEDGFQYRPESIKRKITAKTKAIFINSPSNPTGNLLSQSRMKAIAALADTPNAPYIVSDEIYHGLVYGRFRAPGWNFSRSNKFGQYLGQFPGGIFCDSPVDGGRHLRCVSLRSKPVRASRFRGRSGSARPGSPGPGPGAAAGWRRPRRPRAAPGTPGPR